MTNEVAQRVAFVSAYERDVLLVIHEDAIRSSLVMMIWRNVGEGFQSIICPE